MADLNVANPAWTSAPRCTRNNRRFRSGENLEISAGLCSFDDSERITLARYRQVDGIVMGDLEKQAAVRTTLISLSRGVEKSRPEAEACGDLFPVSHPMADRLEGRVMFRTHFEIGEEREILARGKLIQVRGEIPLSDGDAPAAD